VSPVAARKSAEVRREEVLQAAVKEFARTGLHGTSTEAIARRAGVSQPYLFRLYGTKKDLFLATCARCFELVLAAFREAAEGHEGPEALKAAGQAYGRLLEDREMLLAQMQMYVACEDRDVRGVARRGFAGLYRYVEQASGASPAELRDFFARGMLMNVAAAMDLPEICAADGAWARRLLREKQ
jgi:AcrR family transcriptional regulator